MRHIDMCTVPFCPSVGITLRVETTKCVLPTISSRSSSILAVYFSSLLSAWSCCVISRSSIMCLAYHFVEVFLYPGRLLLQPSECLVLLRHQPLQYNVFSLPFRRGPPLSWPFSSPAFWVPGPAASLAAPV